MVTIISKTANESVITSATIEVAGARNPAHALDLALTDLGRHGWTVSIEQYEAKYNADGTYEITVY